MLIAEFIMDRGLVIAPPVRILNNSRGISMSGGLDLQQLRLNLLLWDRLSYPKQPFIEIGLGPEAEFLERERILERTPVSVPGGLGGIILTQAHYECFRTLDRKEPGKWSLATIEGSDSAVPTASLEEGRGVLVRLLNAIPVPDRDVPLDDVLNFKSKRRSELTALRVHLEDVYQRIVEAADPELKLETELARLQTALEDHIKVSREWKVGLKLADLSANLNIAGAVAGTIASYTMGLPLLQSVVSGVVPAISVDAGAGLARRHVTHTPFKYVSAIHRHFS
ncbi:DUF6236 family protein [Sinorhizobium meliloti]